MNKIKKAAKVISVVVVVLLALPFLLPTWAYIDEAEALASQKLAVPVKIGFIRLVFLPSPRLTVGDVVIGKQNELSFSKVSLIPKVFTLFDETKVIKELSIDDLKIKSPAFDLLKTLSQDSNNSSDSIKIAIRKIHVNNFGLDWPGLRLPEVSADIDLNQDNMPQQANLESTDGTLKIKLIPSGDKALITLLGEKLIAPVGPPIMLDQVRMDMELYGNRLEVRQINIALYKGLLSGNMRLSWNKDWQTSGKIIIEKLALKDAVKVISKTTQLSGNLFTNGNFSAKASAPEGLADNMNADFRFRLDDGVLSGVDLATAATVFLKTGHRGGETKFDNLSGSLNVTGKHYLLDNLQVSSGLIDAAGDVKISPEKELDGVVDVKLKQTVALVAVPLQVSGTVNDPVVYPTKSSVAGAAIGTAVLGPGVGTSLGIKAGSAIEKIKGLF